MHKTFLIWASLLGAIAVILGAFGAHALRNIVTESKIEVFKTAVTYQFYHVFALLALAWLQYQKPNKIFMYAGMFFIIGIILFSGSLYMLTFVELKGLGIITPVGGIFFIAGWIAILIGTIQLKK